MGEDTRTSGCRSAIPPPRTSAWESVGFPTCSGVSWSCSTPSPAPAACRSHVPPIASASRRPTSTDERTLMADSAPLDIVVLAGGISHERDVSLRSGRRIADALTNAGHTVRVVDPDATLFSRLAEHRPDVIWPALHGTTGEDGALLSLLETTGIPFVGARGDDASLAWVKPV